jgi:hypothetical protein
MDGWMDEEGVEKGGGGKGSERSVACGRGGRAMKGIMRGKKKNQACRMVGFCGEGEGMRVCQR